VKRAVLLEKDKARPKREKNSNRLPGSFLALHISSVELVSSYSLDFPFLKRTDRSFFLVFLDLVHPASGVTQPLSYEEIRVFLFYCPKVALCTGFKPYF
jgi:hypothetical protein